MIRIPKSYSASLTCDYRITTGEWILLYFGSFSIESGFYSVNVYDGTSRSDKPLVTLRLSGTYDFRTKEFERVALAESGSMFIRFTSGAGTSGSGVDMHWMTSACLLLTGIARRALSHIQEATDSFSHGARSV